MVFGAKMGGMIGEEWPRLSATLESLTDTPRPSESRPSHPSAHRPKTLSISTSTVDIQHAIGGVDGKYQGIHSIVTSGHHRGRRSPVTLPTSQGMNLPSYTLSCPLSSTSQRSRLLYISLQGLLSIGSLVVPYGAEARNVSNAIEGPPASLLLVLGIDALQEGSHSWLEVYSHLALLNEWES